MKRIIVMLAIVASILGSTPAQAYPMNCYRIPHGQMCQSSTTGAPTARCDVGYGLTASLTCEKLAARPWQPYGVQP
jgi:hypothetical protein